MRPRLAALRLTGLLLLCAVLATGCPKPAPDPSSQANDLSRLKRLEAAWTADTTNPRAGIELAAAYESQEEWAQARRIYEVLLKSSDPGTQALAMNALALLLIKQGQAAEAFGWLWKATSAGEPATKSQAWFLIGEFVRNQQTVPPELAAAMRLPEGAPTPGAGPAARFAYEQAIATGVTDAQVYRSLATMAEAEGNLTAALEQWQVYLAADGSDMAGWLEAARLAEALEQSKLAIFYLQVVATRGTQQERQVATGQLQAMGVAQE